MMVIHFFVLSFLFLKGDALPSTDILPTLPPSILDGIPQLRNLKCALVYLGDFTEALGNVISIANKCAIKATNETELELDRKSAEKIRRALDDIPVTTKPGTHSGNDRMEERVAVLKSVINTLSTSAKVARCAGQTLLPSLESLLEIVRSYHGCEK